MACIFTNKGGFAYYRRILLALFLTLFILRGALCARDLLQEPDKVKLPKIPEIVFQSRPDLYPPKFNVSIYKADKVTDGYYFLAPYGNSQTAPYIYDKSGTLVWSGFGFAGPGNFTEFKVSDYHGEKGNHLSVYQGVQNLLGGAGQGRGHGLFLDNSYHIVGTVQTDLGRITNDQHEVLATPGGKTALVTIYQPLQYDLSKYGVDGIGWISSSIFQEIDLKTGKALFEWSSASWVPPSDSYVPRGKSVAAPQGDGTTAVTAWDYFHINAISKTSDGNYLANSRHTWAFYKISSKDGSILWRLGGKNSSFKQEGYTFSWQHHAREREANKTHTIISLFDNSSNGKQKTRDYSEGQIIVIDHEKKISKLIKSIYVPDKIRSDSQGDFQLLDNGNWKNGSWVIGWGQNAFVSEHTADGETVFYANFNYSDTENYRAYKYPWVGKPKEAPALFVYAETAKDPSVYYISWNGATEVKTWNIFVSDKKDGEYKYYTNIPKKGFETVYKLDKHVYYSYVEAVGDAYGKILHKSRKVKTFVPKVPKVADKHLLCN